MIEYSDLKKVFHDGEKELTIIDQASHSFPRTGAIAIVGASGVGKSTLLQILGALDSATSGEVIIGGRVVSGLSSDGLAAVRQEMIGFIFQFNQLLSDFNALENVAMPLLLKGGRYSDCMKVAELELDRLGLANRRYHRPRTLSGGEQQRVAIARAVVTRPPIILADEPTGSLDPDTASLVEGQLLSTVRELGGLLIVVTHNYSLAKRMDVVLEMRTGGHLSGDVRL